MKTFRWTVPEFPLTEREKNPPKKGIGASPGIGHLIAGLFFIGFGSLILTDSPSFFRSLSTYLWEKTEGTVISADLRQRHEAGMGEITYRLTLDGTPVEHNADVFRKWAFPSDEKFQQWADHFAVGNRLTVFVSGKGETSPGHWPTSYSWSIGTMGLTFLLLGIQNLISGIVKIRSSSRANAA
ncbi:MAG: hypothetical protein KDN20_08540 [Verrucomicrobiae bacterium]|nr:hypothetical protein [Verrucomicrobiae bacterium]